MSTPRRLTLVAAMLVVFGGLSAGWATLGTQQRRWIFQALPVPPASADELARTARSQAMESIWIEHVSASAGQPIRLHGLFAANASADAPLLLFLHGARQNVGRSVFRIEQLRDLGFSVLAIDYRGFGASTDEPPSEVGVVEDAAAAWRWLGARDPARPRYVFGHSLGGAVAVQLAAALADAPVAEAPKGVIVEGTFTSIRDMFGTFKWGWLPISMLITQRFDSLATVPRIKAPLLVVHGSGDAVVPARFGELLYERATAAKRFVLVEGGTHSTTSWRGIEQYRIALHEFFGVG
ncbi:MAG TPA: alpha/beta hydrolase [Caldimonas sp.]|nr:alpha/beta hydrolase [Caldimonas sp.]HEX4233002.1 alpha/beta hydrolase [Caldimonas sp.]